MKPYGAKGFTLIEVTLAIVIGIILIAGATVIYNQAKSSAGNSRAQAKVASLQSLVEQYIARADGVAPDIQTIRALWERARPDDFNKSPWGGKTVPDQYPAGTATNGIIDGRALDATDLGGATDALVRVGDHILGNSGPVVPSLAEPPDATWTGVLVYYRWPDAAEYYVWDEYRRTALPGKTYSVCTTNQRGQRWFFVRGNSAGLKGESNPFGLQGQVQ